MQKKDKIAKNLETSEFLIRLIKILYEVQQEQQPLQAANDNYAGGNDAA